jgi:serine/threonine-protein kinase
VTDEAREAEPREAAFDSVEPGATRIATEGTVVVSGVVTSVGSPTRPSSDVPGYGPDSSAAVATTEPPPSESEEPEARVGRVLADRYRIEELLGAGGMGCVYRAEHVHMRKMFALKVLHREMTYMPEVVARFEREAVAAARIEHQNVVAATDFGRLEDGSFYLVLEHVQGRSLSKELRERDRLAPERALHITRQVAEALSAAHALEIVHRDLKPDNVMLIEHDGDPDFVKVLDFGIAKLRLGDQKEQQLTQLGSVFGTPEYMAPEQAQGTHVDSRADLYTLGIVLYEMLAGRTPFRDDDVMVMLTRQLTAEPPPLPSDVPAAVRALVTSLLRKKPEDRLQTAEDVVAAIDGLLTPLHSVAPVRPRPQLGSGGPGGLLVARAREALGRVLPRPVALLRRPVLLARRRSVPVWMLGLAGLALVAAGAALTVSLAGGSRSAPAGGSASQVVLATTESRSLKKLIEQALAGDREAFAELEARPKERRSAGEWYALGTAHALHEQHVESLAALSAAVEKAPELAEDEALLRLVRKMLRVSEVERQAIELCAGRLGHNGVDLLHELYREASGDSSRSELASKLRIDLEEPALRAKASAALLIALDLVKARGCQAYKALLPRAIEHADERSLSVLRKLTNNRGCGFLSLGDCYACLRASGDLGKALTAAAARKPPGFLGAPDEASGSKDAAASP